MRHLACIGLFIMMISCGNPQQVRTSSATSDNISDQSTMPYSGVLKIYRASSGCMGSGGSHIDYQQTDYQIGTQSTASFNQLIDNLFNNNDYRSSFDQDGCFNYYHIKFGGVFSQEPVWTNGSEIMRKVIHIKNFEVKE